MIKKYIEHPYDPWYYVKNTQNWVHKRLGTKYIKVIDLDKDKDISTITTKQWRTPNAGFIKVYRNELDINKLNLKDISIFEDEKGKYFLRIITEKEAMLFMGFTEEDYDKVIKSGCVSREQIYRQAGNSIVVNCLVAVMNKIT